MSKKNVRIPEDYIEESRDMFGNHIVPGNIVVVMYSKYRSKGLKFVIVSKISGKNGPSRLYFYNRPDWSSGWVEEYIQYDGFSNVFLLSKDKLIAHHNEPNDYLTYSINKLEKVSKKLIKDGMIPKDYILGEPFSNFE